MKKHNKSRNLQRACTPVFVAANALVVTHASGQETTLDEVVVQGQTETSPYQAPRLSSRERPMPVLDTPQTITIIPQALIEDQNATSLRDVLRNVPGISYQAGEGGGGPAGDRFTIRGFNATGDIFVDGIRDFGGYTRDPFNIEQVEVAQGPSSTFNGRGSTGGTVNIVTKKPQLENFYTGDLGIGTNDYYRTTLDVNQTLPSLVGAAVRVNAVFHSQDFANRDYISDERWGIAPSISLGLGTATRGTLSYMHLQQDNLPSYGVLFVPNTVPTTGVATPNPYGGQSAAGKPAPVDNDTFFGLVERDYENVFTDIANLEVEHDFTDDITLSNQTRFGRNFRDSIITSPRLDTATQLINRQFQSRYQTDIIVTNATTLTAEFETWGMKHNFVSSVEYDYEQSKNEPRAAGATAPTISPFVNAAQADPYNPNAYQNDGTWGFTGGSTLAYQNTLGLSLFDTIEITKQWLLSLGLRVDYFTTRVITNPGTVVIVPGAVRTEQNQNEWEPTWNAGLTYKPIESASIYFNYGTSYNPAGELLVSQTTPFNLDPERSQSFEFGGKWDLLKDRLSLNGSIFRTIKDNARSTDPVSLVVTTTGEVRVQGFELGANGSITENWDVFAGYAYLNSRILQDKDPLVEGNRFAQVPQQTFNVWTTYKLPFGFAVGTGVNFVDQRYANNQNTNSVPQYTLQDALLSYKINDHAEIQLNVTNLWNKDYYDRVGGGHAIPGVGRTFVVSTRIQF